MESSAYTLHDPTDWGSLLGELERALAATVAGLEPLAAPLPGIVAPETWDDVWRN